jgi:hypothetical protein
MTGPAMSSAVFAQVLVRPGYWGAWTAAGAGDTAGRMARVRRSAVQARPAA